jgi:ubiquitin-protein ligase
MENSISSYSVKRLIKDVRNINKNPLTDNGIYYNHDEDNMLKGYALIIGPENTPYEKGFYFFELNFPSNYPHSPPMVKFLSNTDNIRIHPNLYRSGKVCISILNTWKGDQWTSCQNIQTILLTLLTIFTENPLLNEPGIRENNTYIPIYNQVIDYINIKFNAIEQIIHLKQNNPMIFYHFIQDIESNFKQNCDYYKQKIQSLHDTYSNCKINISIYSFDYYLDYNELLSNMNSNINYVLVLFNSNNTKKEDDTKDVEKKEDDTKDVEKKEDDTINK